MHVVDAHASTLKDAERSLALYDNQNGTKLVHGNVAVLNMQSIRRMVELHLLADK